MERLPCIDPTAPCLHSSTQECDFDGRPIKASGFSDKSDSLGGKYPFSFHGLETAGRGYELRDFSVRAQFFTDARGSNVAERVSSLCRVDASGVVHATVAYPSIQEIWPAVYSMSSIKAIEVCIYRALAFAVLGMN